MKRLPKSKYNHGLDKTITVAFNLDYATVAGVFHLAQKLGVLRSALVRDALSAGLKIVAASSGIDLESVSAVKGKADFLRFVEDLKR